MDDDLRHVLIVAKTLQARVDELEERVANLVSALTAEPSLRVDYEKAAKGGE